MTAPEPWPGHARRYDGSDCSSSTEDRRGRCYELAGRALTNAYPDGGVLLAHGTIGPLDNPHAWLIYRFTVTSSGGVPLARIDQAWDPVLDTHTILALHLAPLNAPGGLNAKVWNVYTAEQVRLHTLREDSWGPWGPNAERAARQQEHVRTNAHRIDQLIEEAARP